MTSRRSSHSARLFHLLCDARLITLDFLCPQLAHPQRHSEPGPSHQPKRRRTLPPKPPSHVLQRSAKPMQKPRKQHLAPRATPLDIDSVPYKFAQGRDGTFHREANWLLHGRGLTCSGWPTVDTSGGSAGNPSFDLSTGSGNGNPLLNTPGQTVDEDPFSEDFIVRNLPSGWRPDERPTNVHSATTTIGVSVTLALTIAAFIIGLVLWRRPLCGRRKRTADKALEKNLQMLWANGDAERGVPGKDEDPSLGKAAKVKKKAWGRALDRWKAKAKGKAGRRPRRRRDDEAAPGSDETTLASDSSPPVSRAASLRTRVSFDDHPLADDAASASAAAAVLPSSATTAAAVAPGFISPDASTDTIAPDPSSIPLPTPSESSATVPAIVAPTTPSTPPPPPSPPLPPTRHVLAVGSTPALAPHGQAPPEIGPPPLHSEEEDDPEQLFGPPAYRRSYTATVPRRPRRAAASVSEAHPSDPDRGSGEESALVDQNGGATGSHSRRGNAHRERMDGTPTWRMSPGRGSDDRPAACDDRKLPLADDHAGGMAYTEEEEAALQEVDEDEEHPLDPRADAHQAHLATDDKSVLARMAGLASAPGPSAPDAPPLATTTTTTRPDPEQPGADASAPEWRDEELEDFGEPSASCSDHVPERAPPPPPAVAQMTLPLPPVRVVQPSLDHTALAAAVGAPEKARDDDGDADVAALLPSAPPELALEDAPSAPPMFFEDEDGAPEPGPSVPRAPPLDLPRYEP